MSSPPPSSTSEKSTPRGRRVPDRHQLVGIIVIAIVARLFWMALLPHRAYSVDLKDWQWIAARQLTERINPYLDRGGIYLSWPPIWPEVLNVVARVADRFNWDFITSIRSILIAAEIVLTLLTYRLIRLQDRTTPIFKLLLFGFALNPLLILLTIQHGNFDAIAMIGVELFLICLIRFRREGNAIDWIWAALWLGLAVCTKTFPFVLTPMLAPGARRLGWKAAMLGAALVALPTVLSIGPLYLLDLLPMDQGPLGYRSTPGGFGITGLLTLLNLAQLIPWYTRAFTIALLIFLVALGVHLWRHDWKSDTQLIAGAAMMLLGLFTVGSGYGPQYWFWVAPLIVAVYPFVARGFRRAIWVTGAMIVLTNIIEYAIFTDKGRFLYFWNPTAGMLKINGFFEEPKHAVLFRLPMWLAAVVLLGWGCRMLCRRAIASDNSP